MNYFYVFLILAVTFGQVLFGSIWKNYYEVTSQNDKPYETVVIALQNFEAEEINTGTALDLGCGTGRDTLYLLEKGWRVHAIDSEKIAYKYLVKKISPLHLPQFSFEAMPFENLNFEPVLLVNASYSIPFCKPTHLKVVMQRIKDHILIDGRFSGHFFGKKDSRCGNKAMTFLTKEQVLDLFAEFDIEYFEEEEWDGMNGSGPQHHHVYNIVAKKRG